MASEAFAVGPVQRFLRRLGIALMLVAMLPGAAPEPKPAPAPISASDTATLTVDIANVRSDKGMLRMCLTADAADFPDCIGDANAITRSIPASRRSISISGVAPGTYALAVIHDENGNSRLDTLIGIPKEGFGFSRNPAIGFGPPRFSAARFQVADVSQEQDIRMHYIF